MSTEAMTETEYADHLVASTRRSAWTLLAAATVTSLAGNIWHSHRYGSGSVAGMIGAAVAPVFLLGAMHLTGGLNASRRERRVHAGIYPLAIVGVLTLVLIAFWASFRSLRDLLIQEGFDPISAALIPIACDVAVVVSTAALFSLAPRLRRGRVRTPRAASPAPTALQTAAPGKPRPASVQLITGSAPKAAPDTAAVIVESAPKSAPTAAASASKSASPSAASDAETASDIAANAARIVADRVVRQPVETVAAILTAHAGGAKPNPIAADLRIHHSVVGRVLEAAAADRHPHLAAVGN
jgi:hypothetical protein